MSNSSPGKSIFNNSDVLVPTIGVCHEQSPMVSVIILNYNGRQYLHKLFTSLNNQSLFAFEIVFVDNASSDNSINLVKQLCKNLRKGLSIKIIENDRNFGYCKGNNIGASAVQNETKYLVFLNNDTYVDIHWLRNLVQTAELDNKVGAVGSRIVTVQKPSFSTIALACDFYGQTEFTIMPTADRQKADSSNLKFFYCSGASFLVPKELFWEVGGFDEALFMYHDELDLCWRIRLSGYKVAVASSSICYHIKNSSGNGLSLPVWKYYHGIVKNRLRVLLKNYSMGSLLRYFPQTVTLIALRGLLSALVNRDVCYLSALIKGFFWNFKNLKDTLLKRFNTQQLRKVSDNDILNYMVPYSLEIEYFKRLLLHVSGMNGGLDQFLTFEKDRPRITALRENYGFSKGNSNNNCIVTSPVGRAGSTALSNLVKLGMQSSGKVHLICDGALSQSLRLDGNVFVFEVAHRASSNPVMRAVNYLYTQFMIMHYMIVVSKEIHAFIFFLGGENLLIPMLASKLLRKKTLLIFTEIERKTFAVRNDPLFKFILLLVSINSYLADKMVLYSNNMISEGNFTRFKHKIVIAHRHFVDFTQFLMMKKLNERPNVVGYIGRFSEEKGILNFVKSIPIVLKHRKGVRFMLCGEGDLFDEIMDIIRHEGLDAYVKLTGWVSHKEIPILLNDFKLLILSSYTEGLPNVILEAMACGTPVLATSVGAIPEVVTEGKTGFLLKSTLPEHIAERITDLFTHPDLLEKVSKNAQIFVRENFRYEKTLDLWKDILRLYSENE